MRRLLAAAMVLLSTRTARAACAEQLPAGAAKPTLVERVEPRGLAGHLVELEIAVRHLAGESATLPADLPKLLNGEAMVAGSFGQGEVPKAAPDPGDPTHATTILKVPFVVFSTSLQRKTFTLPPVRVIVLRKGGGDLSVCTAAHEIAIDQPTANAPDPLPHPNPPSLPQLTRDERMEAIANAIAATAFATIALVALWLWWRRRPKEEPPPPPPTPSWQLALEAVKRARRDLESNAIGTKVYYDRVSDAVRAHLGERYGFDGLESTTDEILSRLRRLPTPSFPFANVEQLFGECDLVKFANLRPELAEAEATASLAESVIRATAHPIALRPFHPRPEAAS